MSTTLDSYISITNIFLADLLHYDKKINRIFVYNVTMKIFFGFFFWMAYILFFLFQYAMTNMAKCHLLMGHWVDAMKAAEIVMARDRKNIQAIEVKAESLYNSCFFEHALVLFHRGRVCVLPYSC